MSKVLILGIVHALLGINSPKDDIIEPLDRYSWHFPLFGLVVLVSRSVQTNDGVIVSGEESGVLSSDHADHVLDPVAISAHKAGHAKFEVFTGW